MEAEQPESASDPHSRTLARACENEEVWDEPWKPLFLAELQKRRSVTMACLAARVGRRTAYDHRDRDQRFREAWEERWERNIDALEASLMQRAIRGWHEPVFHKGAECGAIRRFDNRLGEFMLKKLRPEKYGDEVQTASADLLAAAINAFVQSTRAQNTAEGDTTEGDTRERPVDVSG